MLVVLDLDPYNIVTVTSFILEGIDRVGNNNDDHGVQATI